MSSAYTICICLIAGGVIDHKSMSSDDSIMTMRSLSPDRESCIALEALGLLLREEGGDPERCVTIVAMMGLLRQDVLRHFPENIFYDDEVLARALLKSEDHEALFGKFRVLLALFGQHSPIRFRYVHDWLYGYDWIKWVSRNPEHAESDPFCEAFVDYMMTRGEEILASISSGDDEAYKPLNGDSPRNIYGFSRLPPDEIWLMETLAKENKLPLNAWDIKAGLVSDQDYFALRLQCAKKLGFAFPSGGKTGNQEFPSDGKSDEEVSIEWKRDDPDGLL